MMTETLLASPATDRDFLRDLLSRALAAGASDAQVQAQFGRSVGVEIRDGDLQGIEQAEGSSVQLTTYIGKRRATLGTNKFNRASINEFIERVIGMTRLAVEDPYCGLAPAELLAPVGDDSHLELLDPHEPDIDALKTMAIEVEEAARSVTGVTSTQMAQAGWSTGEARLLASNGLDRLSQGSSSSVGVSVVAGFGNNREVSGAGRSAHWRGDLPDLSTIGEEAGKDAVAKLNARKIRSGTAAVLFDRRIAMSLLGPFLGAIAGESIARKTSFLQQALGERVFPEDFTMTDDAFIVRGHASRACDAEGVVPKARALVDAGVLTTWLVNCAVSRELGIPSTGHAGGPTNVMVLPGQKSQQELMEQAGTGLLVTGLMGTSLNPHTGDWSVGVSGQWFEGGEIAYPVSEVTIAGCLPELYKELVHGSDLEIRGAANSPSLLVPSMSIGGS